MKNNNDAPDIVTPLVATVEVIVKFLIELLKFAYRKLLNIKPQLSKIEIELLKKNKRSLDSHCIGFSLNQKRELPIGEINFDKHTFIVGAAGFGKTNLISLMQEHDLQQGRPVIFFDPKGDLEALLTFKNLCEKYDRKVAIFSEHYGASIQINPLKHGTINQIADRIIDSFTWENGFYRDLAYFTLEKIVKKIQALNLPVTFSLILQELEVQEDLKPEAVIGLKAKLSAIVNSDYGPLLEDNGHAQSLQKIREEKLCLYIGLSTQGYGQTARGLGKIFVNDLKFHSYSKLSKTADSHESMNQAMSVYFDEAGSLLTPEFIELQNKCRAAGIRITLACQSTSDIDRVSPDLTKQVIENVSNLFILKQMIEQSSAFLSKSVGTIASTKKTYVTEDDEKSGKGSIREVNELLVHPDVLKGLRVGQCVLVRFSPLQVDLINLREQRRAKIASPPPIETSTKQGNANVRTHPAGSKKPTNILPIA